MAKKAKADDKPKRGVGQPRIFETLEELEHAIESFFEYCEKGELISRYDKKEKMFVEGIVEIPQTIEALAVHLGMTRRTLLNYEKENYDPQFFPTITRAKERITAWKMKQGWRGDVDPRILQFDLQNNARYRGANQTPEELEKDQTEKTESFVDLGNGSTFEL